MDVFPGQLADGIVVGGDVYEEEKHQTRSSWNSHNERIITACSHKRLPALYIHVVHLTAP